MVIGNHWEVIPGARINYSIGRSFSRRAVDQVISGTGDGDGE